MNKLFLVFLFFAYSSLRAQLLFTTLKPADGLSSRETRCVYRDDEGCVWTGTTNGLNRFDGARFKLWNTLSAGYPEGLGEIVTTITEHGKGQVWFGTNNGIGLLDKYSNTIKQIPIRSFQTNSRYIGRLAHDKNGRLWACTGKGLLVEQEGEFVAVSALYPFAKKLDSLVYNNAAFIFDAKRNCFWIGTSSGSFCLDFTRGQLYSGVNNPEGVPFFTNDLVSSIALDTSNNIWFSNATAASLCFYNFKTKALQQITHINNNPDWKLDAGCNNLFADAQGRLWISTWLYSAFMRYPDGRFEEIPYERDRPFSIGYGFFHDAFQDKYGNVWLATINGLSKLEAGRFIENIVQAPSYRFYLTTGFANINTMQIDEQGNWWLGKMEGLVKYDRITKGFDRFTVSATDLRANEVFDLKLIKGETWCATSKGLRIFNPTTKKFRTFDKYPGKNGNELFINWMFEDKDGFIWSGVWKEGVYRHDPVSGLSVHFNESNDKNWQGFKTKNSSCAFQSRNGKIWIDAGEEGVWIFDPGTQKFLKPVSALLHKAGATSITEDANENIWLCVRGQGIIKANAQGRVLDSITRKNGLPLNVFHDLSADASGRLWAVSRENLICVLPETKEVTKVTIPANFSFNDHWNSLLKKGNLLYATMLDMVVVINTDRYQQLPQHVSPLISSFLVFGQEVPLQQDADLELDYN